MGNEGEVSGGVLDKPRVLKAIRLHMAAHPEPLATRRVANALKCDEKTWRDTRDLMVEAGIMEKITGQDGIIPWAKSVLTPEGVRIGEHVLAADAEEARARKRKEKGREKPR